MAVTIVKYKQKDLIAIFGLQKWSGQLFAHKIKLVCMNKSVKLICGGAVVGSVKIPLNAVGQMRKGLVKGKKLTAYKLAMEIHVVTVIHNMGESFGPDLNTVLKILYGTAAHYAIVLKNAGLVLPKTFEQADGSYIDPSEYDEAPKFIPAPIKKYYGKTKAKEEVAKGFLSDYEPVNKDQMLNSFRVLLSQATHLYQPVMATSEKSRYFVVAARDDLKVACRYHSNVVSVRVEGNLTKYILNLGLVGFAWETDAIYTSMHLQVENPTMAGKTVGAIISGMNVEFLTKSPNVSNIAGLGG